MSHVLEDIPVRVVNNEMTALLGAGRLAAEALTTGTDQS
jgi:glucokinase